MAIPTILPCGADSCSGYSVRFLHPEVSQTRLPSAPSVQVAVPSYSPAQRPVPLVAGSLGIGYVFVGGWTEDTEIWRLAPDGESAGFSKSKRIHDPSGQEWSVSEVPGIGWKVYYPVG